MARRLPWQLVIAAALLVSLAALGTMQYRWVGEVSDAERERLRTGLQNRASEFTRAFDAQITRMFVAFHIDPADFERDPDGTVASAYARWEATSATPALVRGIYFVERAAGEPPAAKRFSPERKALEPAALPADVAASLERARQSGPRFAIGTGVPSVPDAIDARLPALFVPVPRMRRTETGDGHFAVVAEPSTIGARVVAIVIDPDRLRHDVLEPLVAAHFGDRSTSDYVLTIASRDDPSQVIFSTSDVAVTSAAADVSTGFFDLRLDEVTRLAAAQSLPPPKPTTERFAITIVRRAGGDASHTLLSASAPGAWELRVRHRSGSLDAVVARSRRRNLGVGLGILGLLGASVVLVIAASQRQQRLARQQMEFVASVSHELRTPLAVICSAAENLADGVVADPSQVKRYGDVIETEGRRLADMVERVMTFAGARAGVPARQTSVDLAAVIDEAVQALSADANDRGVSVRVETDAALPAVLGDPDALRSAVQNIVGNAVKYSRRGAGVDVGAAARNGHVEIRVADQGLGIDARDLPHVFEPFFRGRRALDAQVRGSGIGLSVVRSVVDAHRGTIRVDSAPDRGTTVIVDLPAAGVA